MPPKDFTIRVTLTSIKDSVDRRHITLTPGEPCIIGRASKSTEKNLQAGPTNGLFDCPVVSRQHAELRSHPWAPLGDQVSIIDHGSMHGTRVNGVLLKRGENMSLRSGDVIQFGERVSRGEGIINAYRSMFLLNSKADAKDVDTHEGILVTFDRVSTNVNNTQASHTFAASQPYVKRGYSVPSYASDDEELDQRSDDGSMISDDEQDERDERPSSSAHTTPEQGKAELGSAQKPIDLDLAPGVSRIIRAEVIDIDDSDEQMPPPPPPEQRPAAETMRFAVEPNDNPPHVFDSQRVIQDSVDKNNSFYEPVSLARTSYEQLGLEEGPDITYHKLGPPDVMVNDDTGSVSNDSESAFGSDDFEKDHEPKEDGRNMDAGHGDNTQKHVPGDYYSDAESPYDVVNEDEDGEDEDEGQELQYSMRKEPSPELGSPSGFAARSSACDAPRYVPNPPQTMSSGINDSPWVAPKITPLSPQQSLAAAQPNPTTDFHSAYGVTSAIKPNTHPIQARTFNDYQYPSQSGSNGPFPAPPVASRGVRNPQLPAGQPSTFFSPWNYSNSHTTSLGNTKLDALRSSRWDVGPSRQAFPYPTESTHGWPATIWGPAAGPPAFASAQKDSAQSLPQSMRIDGGVLGFQHNWENVPPMPQHVQDWDLPKPPSRGMCHVAQEAAKKDPLQFKSQMEHLEPPTPKNKISIANIVEDPFAGNRREELKKMTPTGGKRKASEMMEPSLSSPTWSALTNTYIGGTDVSAGMRNDTENLAQGTSTDEREDLYSSSEPEDDEPAPRRRRLGLEDNEYVPTPVSAQKQGGSAITEVMKVAGSAFIGGAVTVGFLLSPLAETAYDWLGTHGWA